MKDYGDEFKFQWAVSCTYLRGIMKISLKIQKSFRFFKNILNFCYKIFSRYSVQIIEKLLFPNISYLLQN